MMRVRSEEDDNKGTVNHACRGQGGTAVIRYESGDTVCRDIAAGKR